MLSSLKRTWLLAAGLGGVAILCPLCDAGLRIAGAQSVDAVATQTPDTATVRLHISRMFCGELSHDGRARVEASPGRLQCYGDVGRQSRCRALRPPARVTPAHIAAHLTKLTGFGATVLASAGKTP